MKNSGYILLLIILLLQAGGMLFIFNVQKGYVQYEMSEKLKSSETSFEKLTLTLSEYQKSRVKSDEISLNGKMYDIKLATVIDNAVELLVIHDIEEEDILEKIKNLIKNTGQTNKELPNQLHKLISLVYLSPFSEHQLFIPSFYIHIFHQSMLLIVFNKPDILSPPPRLV